MPATHSSSRNRDVPSVLIIGSEALPFAKTGGLADVLGALSTALARLDWDVTLVLPRYRGITAGELAERMTLSVGAYTADAGFYEAPLADGARALLVDIPDLYDRDELYGVDNVDYPDNPRRFAVLVRAALEISARRGPPPSVVHAHDWQAGLAPVYLKTVYADHPLLAGTPTVFTIHNLAYQGLFEPDWLPRLDLPWNLLSMDRLEFWGRISFLKGGINDSEIITTVSRKYAEEIQTPELGFGFDGILRRRAADLVGILNGIDTEQWNPAHDPHLPASFNARDLSGKRAAKAELLSRFALPADEDTMQRPLVGMISRMVDQKGFDLIAAIGDELPRLDATFVVLGTGEARYQYFWRELATRHPHRISAKIGFDEPLAHLIEGGADLFLMPSRFEPCGLNQMYSLRYGTVPIVRAVGGLADTICDYTPATPKLREGGPATPKRREERLDAPKRGERGLATSPGGNPRAATASRRRPARGLAPPIREDGSREVPTGFVFHEYTSEALLDAIERALLVFKDQRKWRALQVAGMKQDHSWDRSAREYVKIYARAIERGRRLGTRG